MYPLSESQLDRFMMLVSLNIPVAEEELSVYRKHANAEAVRLSAASSLSSSELLEYRAEVGKVFVEESLLRYSQEIAQKLRTTDDVVHAASVRSMLQLIDAAKARAFLFDREFVLPEDISKLAPDILGHRLCFRSGEVSSLQRKEIVRDAVDRVDPPR